MATIQTALPRQTARRAFRLRKVNPLLASGMVILLALILFAVGGGLLIDHSYAEVGAFLPRQTPNAERVLGTDSQGRDVLAVLILSTPNTLMIGLVAGIAGIATGTILGLLSGFFGGWVDTVIRTITDVFITIPGIAILIVIATNIRNIDVAVMALIVASLAWRFPARAIRAQTLSLRERGYIQIARLNGVGGLELVVREVLPNLLPYIAASFVSTVSQSILATIGLEALGLGPQNEYTLGMMIYWAQFYGAILRGMWWWWTPPIVVIVLIFVGLLLTSAGLDEFVNTRLRKVK
ncbi:MAG: ABC transporter permease [Chloroflexota bacterium]|nr:MAG: maltose ABC transporter permease [Chloroflexota bacterium]